ncbi:MAG: 30S ribosome-binding factor RbfA [Bacteroidetes bacterium]|nr:30S ribosome-binding factor RbfA [Bacteroidota bacterium]
MDSKRQQKISRMLQRDVSEIFQRNTAAWAKGALVTVTKVKITSDLSIARIYLSIFATGDKAAILDHINGQKRDIRFHLGQKVKDQLRKVPELEFFQDDSLDYIENIDNLLKQ